MGQSDTHTHSEKDGRATLGAWVNT